MSIITFRPNDNKYPWFLAAQESFQQMSIDPLELIKLMINLDCVINIQHLNLSISIPKQLWITMIRNRFWSNLFKIPETVLFLGLQKMEADIKSESIEIHDKLFVIILEASIASSVSKKGNKL